MDRDHIIESIEDKVAKLTAACETDDNKYRLGYLIGYLNGIEFVLNLLKEMGFAPPESQKHVAEERAVLFVEAVNSALIKIGGRV